MTTIQNWIYAKLEYIIGAIGGTTVLALDIPHFILKIIMAIILGAAGALGSHLFKVLATKLKRK